MTTSNVNISSMCSSNVKRLSRHFQYSFDCSSMRRWGFFCATLATAITISLVLRQFSSVLVARKRAVAAMFCIFPGSLASTNFFYMLAILVHNPESMRPYTHQ